MIIIYVYNLFPWVCEKNVAEVFDIFGPTEEIKISRRDDKPNERLATVIYRHDACAKQAMNHLSHSKTKIGNPIKLFMREINSENDEVDCVSKRVSEMSTSGQLVRSRNQGAVAAASSNQAKQNNLLFVKNFKDYIDEDKMKSLFESFGEINSVSVKREDGKSLGYGFVDFKEHEAAVEAVRKISGMEICGRKIFVSFAESKSEREKTLIKETPDNKKVVLYIKNLPKEFSREQLEQLFSRFGVVSSVSIKSGGSGAKSVGFVCYESADAAAVALKKMDGTLIGSNKLEVLIKK